MERKSNITAIPCSYLTSFRASFRWAQLCLDRLTRCRTGRDVKTALADMPSTLNETYAAIIERIPASDKRLAREALMWLCFLTRPLSLGHFAEAVVLNEGDRSLDDDCRLHHPEALLDICAGLVEVDDGELALSHASIRSFLSSDWIRASRVSEFAMDPAVCNRTLMRKCLTYLSFDEFAKGPVTDDLQLLHRFKQWPLADYAAQNWMHHAKMFAFDSSDERMILDMFATKHSQENGGVFESWVQLLLSSVSVETIRQTEPLYYAASYNMVPIVKLLLRPGSGVDIDKPGGRMAATPLNIACFRRNTEAALLLLKAGADPNAFDLGTGRSARNMAIARKMNVVVELMDKIAMESGP
jgi:hypothetical protein